MAEQIRNTQTGRLNTRLRVQRGLRSGRLNFNNFNTGEDVRNYGGYETTYTTFNDGNLIWNNQTQRFVGNNYRSRININRQRINYENREIDNILGAGEAIDVNIRNNTGMVINSRRFLERLEQERGDNQRLIITLENGSIYTLSTNFINRLVEMLENGIVVGEQITSDDEVIHEFQQANRINVRRLNNTNNQMIGGGFFPYLVDEKENKLIDFLKKLDIYNNIDDVSTEDNCLIVALRTLGVPESKLNKIKFSINGSKIPQHKLKQLCCDLDIQIQIHRRAQGKHKVILGAKSSPIYHICLEEGHYFARITTPFTKYALDNWDTIDKTRENWNWLCENGTKKRERDCCDSWKLVIYLLENKDKWLISMKDVNSLFQRSQYYKNEMEITELNYEYGKHKVFNEKLGFVVKEEYGDLREANYYERKRDENIIGYEYFDVETFNIKKGEPNSRVPDYEKLWEKNPTATIHNIYLLCVSNGNGFIETYWGDKCGKKFLETKIRSYGEEITEEKKIWDYPKLVLYAHNARYDLNFIMKYIHDYSMLENSSSSLITAGGYVKCNNKILQIEIRDSYKLITEPLKKFGKMFNLDVSKEYMPYSYFNFKNVSSALNSGNYFVNFERDVLPFIPPNKKDDFMKCAEDANCLNGELINMMKYAEYYCKKDVEVLKKGVEKFGEWIDEALNIDVRMFYTIPSIAHEYFMKRGCYDDTFSCGGVVREFINRCLVGGRTMLKENQKQMKIIKTADYDAVSLYPSAMKRMRGFLRGKPKVIQPETDWEKQDGFFVQLRLTDIKKHRQFPMMSLGKDGIRKFTDYVEDYEGSYIYVDREMFEIFKEYHKIEYEFIRGYYFDEGFNTDINAVIEEVFNNRLEAKRQGNPIEKVWKLVMNSGYGKSITKPHDTSEKYIYEDELDNFIYRHYDWIKDAIVPVPRDYGKNLYRIKKIEPIHEHFNFCHIGIEILSMSKRIMADVMYLGEDIGCDIYYTDTDSMHIKFEDVSKLEDAYLNKYNKVLCGKMMGQFHIDFDMFGGDEKKKCKDIYSDLFIGLGKKCYIDRLRGTDIITGEERIDYHIRMKGCPEKCIWRVAHDDFNGDILKIYQDLYEGKKIRFDLLKGYDEEEGGNFDKCAFQYHKNFIVSNRTEFPREIKF